MHFRVVVDDVLTHTQLPLLVGERVHLSIALQSAVEVKVVFGVATVGRLGVTVASCSTHVAVVQAVSRVRHSVGGEEVSAFVLRLCTVRFSLRKLFNRLQEIVLRLSEVEHISLQPHEFLVLVLKQLLILRLEVLAAASSSRVCALFRLALSELHAHVTAYLHFLLLHQS